LLRRRALCGDHGCQPVDIRLKALRVTGTRRVRHPGRVARESGERTSSLDVVAVRVRQVTRRLPGEATGVRRVLSRAFAGNLAGNGGGAILNVLSVASWVNRPILSGYGVSRSAAWGLTNGLRHSLRDQHTQVVALHAGFIDTDLTRGLDVPKATPSDVVRQAYEAIEAGAEEVSTDDFTREVKAGLSTGVYLNEPAPR